MLIKLLCSVSVHTQKSKSLQLTWCR